MAGAHMKPILFRCVCGKPATHEVFNRFNASQGRWCAACAKARIAELNHDAEGPAHPKHRGDD